MTEIKINNSPKRFVLISYKFGSNFAKPTNRLETKSQRHFARKLKLLNSQIECYLRVSYGGGRFNDGYYDNKDDLMLAFEAFCEK